MNYLSSILALFVAFFSVIPSSPASLFTGTCTLAQFDKIGGRQTDALIIAKDLDTSGSAGERNFVSNDGTIRLQILKTRNQPSGSMIQINVYQNSALAYTNFASGGGGMIGFTSSFLLQDGTALAIRCTLH